MRADIALGLDVKSAWVTVTDIYNGSVVVDWEYVAAIPMGTGPNIVRALTQAVEERARALPDHFAKLRPEYGTPPPPPPPVVAPYMLSAPA